MASSFVFIASKITALFALFGRWAVAPWMVVVSLFENISLLRATDEVDGMGGDEVDGMGGDEVDGMGGDEVDGMVGVSLLSLSIICSRYLPTFTFYFSFSSRW